MTLEEKLNILKANNYELKEFPEYQDDISIVMSAIQNNPENLQYASDRVKNILENEEKEKIEILLNYKNLCIEEFEKGDPTYARTHDFRILGNVAETFLNSKSASIAELLTAISNIEFVGNGGLEHGASDLTGIGKELINSAKEDNSFDYTHKETIDEFKQRTGAKKFADEDMWDNNGLVYLVAENLKDEDKVAIIETKWYSEDYDDEQEICGMRSGLIEKEKLMKIIEEKITDFVSGCKEVLERKSKQHSMDEVREVITSIRTSDINRIMEDITNNSEKENLNKEER